MYAIPEVKQDSLVFSMSKDPVKHVRTRKVSKEPQSTVELPKYIALRYLPIDNNLGWLGESRVFIG